MDANTTKKAYAAPTLASHGSVIAKTEANLVKIPLESDHTPSKAE